MDDLNFYHAVYKLVRKIPKGRVMTYGQIATILGAPRAARAVGYAMRASDNQNVPWQRVINSKGQISTKGRTEEAILQRKLLVREGVKFDASETVDLDRYRWEPKNPDRFYYAPSKNAPF